MLVDLRARPESQGGRNLGCLAYFWCKMHQEQCVVSPHCEFTPTPSLKLLDTAGFEATLRLFEDGLLHIYIYARPWHAISLGSTAQNCPKPYPPLQLLLCALLLITGLDCSRSLGRVLSSPTSTIPLAAALLPPTHSLYPHH